MTSGGLAVPGRLVVEAGVALAAALQLVEEVDDHLGERHQVVQLDPLRRQVLELVELAAALLAQLHQRPRVVGRRDDRHLEERLLDEVDALRVGQLGRVVDLDDLAVGAVHAVLDARRGGDQGEPELALEALLDDLHVQQPEEAAAESEPEGAGRLRGVADRGVVELELLQRVAQVLEVVAVDREQSRRTPSASGRGSPAAPRWRRRTAVVTVSPERASATSLIPAIR